MPAVGYTNTSRFSRVRPSPLIIDLTSRLLTGIGRPPFCSATLRLESECSVDTHRADDVRRAASRYSTRSGVCGGGQGPRPPNHGTSLTPSKLFGSRFMYNRVTTCTCVPSDYFAFKYKRDLVCKPVRLKRLEIPHSRSQRPL